jgi:hypothetical protein
MRSLGASRFGGHQWRIALDRTLEDVANAKLLADLRSVDVLALEAERGIARDHQGIAEARKVGCEALGDPVGEIVLGGVTRQVCERQHDCREMRGLRWFHNAFAEV